MPSLFLGRIGNAKKVYEIHALTKDLPFREFPTARIADAEMFKKVVEGRFSVLEQLRPIYCTAVNPDCAEKVEINPHDLRPGTVHVVALDENKEIDCSLSMAVDLCETDNGAPVGIPLENRWRPAGFPEGANLDAFRSRYIRAVHKKDRDILPWEMAECYRHFRLKTPGSTLAGRFGIYVGCYHLLVREAINVGRTPTSIWAFDAIPNYFGLYKIAGGAVLRDPLIVDKPRFISPRIDKIEERLAGDAVDLFYKGEKISRNVTTTIPLKDAVGRLHFERKAVPFLDGVVDITMLEESVMNTSSPFHASNIEEFTLKERMKLRLAFGVINKRYYDVDMPSGGFGTRLINRLARTLMSSDRWEFNDIGK